MLRQIFSYCILFSLLMQAALAGVDVHVMQGENAPIDISHHYLDDHSGKQVCNESGENDSGTPEKLSNHSENSHHGCSGHVISMYWQSYNPILSSQVPDRAVFNYSAGFYSVISIPSIKPPIYS